MIAHNLYFRTLVLSSLTAALLVIGACGTTPDAGSARSPSASAGMSPSIAGNGGGGAGAGGSSAAGSAALAGASSGGDTNAIAGAGLGGAGDANAGGAGGGNAGQGGASGGLAGGTGGAPPTESRLDLGILPDYDNAKSATNGIAGFVSRTTVVPFLAGNYMNINAGSFSTSQAKSFIDEALAAHVKCAMISLATGDSDVSSGAQAQIAAAVAYGVQKSIIVQIRFGYEMNGNWSPSYHGGDPTIFKSTWAKVASAVHGAGGQMVWAPNIVAGGIEPYQAVLPSDKSTIDVVGLDFYHFNSSETNLSVGADEVDKAFASIYPLVMDLAKPFVLTETAISYFVTSGAWPDATPGEIAEKLSWLKQLTSPALIAKYPLYRGFVWFDYNKHESNEYRDFSISQQASEATMFTAWVSQDRAELNLGG
jgi:hypothetical protein